MKRQKICIIGGSLTGLVTAIGLSKLNCDIDLVTKDFNINNKFNGTIAISQNNFNFLKNLGISQSLSNKIWPCSIMKLYTRTENKKFTEILEFKNNNNEKKNVLYMLENSKIINFMINKIKKTKCINVKRNIDVEKISDSGLLKTVETKNNNNSKYNLIILCAGQNSSLVKNIFNDKFIENSYNEFAITGILGHKMLKNNTARQIFLDNEILALLPISNTKTSFVWSVKKGFYNKNEFLIKKKINLYSCNFFKNIKFISKIKYSDLNLLIRKKYYKERILLFGDALHKIHPLAGQGFNMTLRDLISLEKTLKNKINLGLDIGHTDVLSEFSQQTKPRNLAYSLGIDFIKGFFSIKEKKLKNLRNIVVANLNKNVSAKVFFQNIADKGLEF